MLTDHSEPEGKKKHRILTMKCRSTQNIEQLRIHVARITMHIEETIAGSFKHIFASILTGHCQGMGSGASQVTAYRSSSLSPTLVHQCRGTHGAPCYHTSPLKDIFSCLAQTLCLFCRIIWLVLIVMYLNVMSTLYRAGYHHQFPQLI